MNNFVPCAYCGQSASPNKGLDHVFARNFYRDLNVTIQNPIKVPSCAKCNNDKSKLETYVPVITHIASNLNLTDKNIRAINHFSFSQKKDVLDGDYGYYVNNGLYVPGVKLQYDWDTASKLYEYIAMGLIYEYCGKQSIKPQYSNRIIAGMPDNKVCNDIQTLLSCQGVFCDNNRYGDKIKYVGASLNGKALVYFQILNASFFNEDGDRCSIIAGTFNK